MEIRNNHDTHYLDRLMMPLATKKKMLIIVTCLLPAYLYRQQWFTYKEKKRERRRKRNGSPRVLKILIEIELTTLRDSM